MTETDVDGWIVFILIGHFALAMILGAIFAVLKVAEKIENYHNKKRSERQ